MANSRPRKTAPTRTAVQVDDPIESTDSIDDENDDENVEAEDAAPVAKKTPPAKSAKAVKPGMTAKTTRPGVTKKTARPGTTGKTENSAATAKTAKSGATVKSAKSTTAPKGTKSAKSVSSSGRRFGDGGSADGARKKPKAPPTKSNGRGGRGGRRPAPAVRVGTPKPWGTIIATIAVLVFAAGAIGYAVYQANSSAVPDSPSDIDGITIAEYAAGQEHVTTDVTYDESPPIGGPHDGYWADCDGAVYDQQIRSENAIHSLEHGAVWITYNPDISDDDLAVLTQYVQNQPYIMLSPYEGLTSPISLQSWNHQLFVDSVDDSRINDFIQVLRQNPEEFPEVGAGCSQPTFLSDPVLEGEASRTPTTGPVNTDAPTTP